MARAKTCYPKGTSGNPAGRPKGIKQKKWSRELLMQALDAAGEGKGEKDTDLTFLQHCCNRAFENDQMAIVLLHKLLPSLRQVDIEQIVQGNVTITHKQIPENLQQIIEYDQTG